MIDATQVKVFHAYSLLISLSETLNINILVNTTNPEQLWDIIPL